MNRLLTSFGWRLAGYLSRPRRQGVLVATVEPELLAATLRPGDVLLVEGNTRISVAIKYLTQSTWSHAALFVGDVLGSRTTGGEPCTLIEADLRDGVRGVALSTYSSMHTRICRPVGLMPQDIQQLIDHAIGRLGQRYDLRNVIDLARYLVPTPPVPTHWRRRLIALGSGDPSRAICSTLIAQAFQSLHYPILPNITLRDATDSACRQCHREVLHIRHYSLYAPRDFDVSPFFEVVKPGLGSDFDYRSLTWDLEPAAPEVATVPDQNHGLAPKPRARAAATIKPMTRPALSLIAAVARNGAIGRGNGLLWTEPEDQKHFRRVTMGSPVVMGRKTWDSLPARFRPLPGRRNVVVTRSAEWRADGAEAVASIDAALALLAGSPRAFVIGGAEVYALALPLADELVLTEIDADLDGDTFFPPWDRGRYTCIGRDPRVGYSFVTYRKTAGD